MISCMWEVGTCETHGSSKTDVSFSPHHCESKCRRTNSCEEKNVGYLLGYLFEELKPWMAPLRSPVDS